MLGIISDKKDAFGIILIRLSGRGGFGLAFHRGFCPRNNVGREGKDHGDQCRKQDNGGDNSDEFHNR